MKKNQNQYHEIEKNLKISFREFYMFSLDLIKELNENNKNLKFAVVNMQIALELFLKYYFLKQEKYDWLFVNKTKIVFRDFSSILDRFFHKDSNLLVTHKNHLKKILEARNKIVHEGKSEWDQNILISLINTTLFIQNVLNREFNETLLESGFYNTENKLADNEIWRLGAENFAKTLASLNKKDVYECWFCYSHSFVDKKIFTCDEVEDEGFQCVTCFNTFYLHHQIGLAKCVCDDMTFVVDALNPQRIFEYHGKCLKCDFSYFAYKCERCETYFVDIEEKRLIKSENKVYCSEECKQEKPRIYAY